MKELLQKNLLKFIKYKPFQNHFNKYTHDNSIIFMMHRFFDPSINYINDSAIKPDFLEQCIEYMIKNDYKIISLNDLLYRIKKKEILNKTICITIDDGYKDMYNVAFPIFKKYNVPATVFITANFINGELMMLWDKLELLLKETNINYIKTIIGKEHLELKIDSLESKKFAYYVILKHLKKLKLNEINITIEQIAKIFDVELPEIVPQKYSAISIDDIKVMSEHNITFEPHTMNHPILAREEYNFQKKELKGSIKFLKDKLGMDPKVFSYTNGQLEDYNNDTISVLKGLNIEYGVTGVYGFVGFMENINKVIDPFQLRRMPFPHTFDVFYSYISGFESFKNSFRKV